MMEPKLLNQDHFQDAVDVFTRTFCAGDPMTQYLGIRPEEFKPFASFIVQKAIDEQLSSVLFVQDKLAGLCIVDDFANPLVLPSVLSQKFKPIFGFLEHLTKDFFEGKEEITKQIAHLFVTAIDTPYQGQGFSKMVNNLAISLAKSKGYSLMLCEFTNLWNEQGLIPYLPYAFEKIGSSKYKDFIFEDSLPFEQLSGGASAYLWSLLE